VICTDISKGPDYQLTTCSRGASLGQSETLILFFRKKKQVKSLFQQKVRVLYCPVFLTAPTCTVEGKMWPKMGSTLGPNSGPRAGVILNHPNSFPFLSFPTL
jgi:hypothetical protein